MAVQSQDDGFGPNASVNGTGEVNQLVARRGKKRIKPTFVASLTTPSSQVGPMSHVSYSQPGPSQSSMSGPGHPGTMHVSHGFDQAYDMGGSEIRLPAPPLQSVPALGNAAGHAHYGHGHLAQPQIQHGQWIQPAAPYSNNVHGGSPFYVPPPGQGMDMSRSASVEDVMMGGVPTIDAYGPEGKGKGRRKAGDGDGDGPRGRARTLGGDRVREVGPVREIPLGQEGGGPMAVGGGGPTHVGSVSAREHVLPVPSVKTYISVRVEGSEDVLEGSNFEDSSEWACCV
jgi:protein HIRA/HIR1